MKETWDANRSFQVDTFGERFYQSIVEFERV